MTALEAIGAVSIGLVSGLMLPGYVQRGLAKVGVGCQVHRLDDLRLHRLPRRCIDHKHCCFRSVQSEGNQHGNGFCNRHHRYCNQRHEHVGYPRSFGQVHPKPQHQRLPERLGGYGYLGNPGHMEPHGAAGAHMGMMGADDGMFGVHQGYGNSNSNMFGAGREMNFY